jgi:ABC-2 type transport system permease protein
MLGLSSVFGKASGLGGYDADFRTFIVPVGLLQGAGFTGAATGVNLARDIEQGWFDRLLLCPAPRATILAGVVASAGLRALLPATFLLIVAFALGVTVPTAGGLLIAAVLVMGLACAMACFSVTLALRFRTQQAAPLMQIASFIGVLFTTSYAPRALLTDWLRAVADVNPVTPVLDGVRQVFIGGVAWETTWPALLSIAVMLAVLGALAARGLRRYGV